jgi:hypothetical protein
LHWKNKFIENLLTLKNKIHEKNYLQWKIDFIKKINYIENFLSLKILFALKKKNHEFFLLALKIYFHEKHCLHWKTTYIENFISLKKLLALKNYFHWKNPCIEKTSEKSLTLKNCFHWKIVSHTKCCIQNHFRHLTKINVWEFSFSFRKNYENDYII